MMDRVTAVALLAAEVPNRRPPRLGPASAVAAAVLVALSVAGCESTSDGLGPALAAFDRGDHAESARLAADEADRTAGADAQAAARYLEGLAYLESGRPDRAVAPLEQAVNDPEVGPRAEAAIGLAFVAMNRTNDGAVRLMAAADRLEPAEASRARRAARAAWRSIDDPRGESPGSGEVSAGQAGNPGFGVQVGAFRTRTGAERAARELVTGLGRLTPSAPTVSPRPAADGRMLWAVRLGPFPNRRTAERFATDHGEPGWRVVALGR